MIQASGPSSLPRLTFQYAGHTLLPNSMLNTVDFFNFTGVLVDQDVHVQADKHDTNVVHKLLADPFFANPLRISESRNGSAEIACSPDNSYTFIEINGVLCGYGPTFLINAPCDLNTIFLAANTDGSQTF